MRPPRRLALRGSALWHALVVCPWAHAQTTAAPAPAPIVSLMQMLLALAIVLGVIAVFAWFMRRLARGQSMGGGALKLRGGIMLGPRERVLLIEVADTWIVVGVGGGQVSALHAMPKPANAEPLTAEPAMNAPFNRWLQRAMGAATKKQ